MQTQQNNSNSHANDKKEIIMERKTIKRIEAVYWPLITVGYLIYSFATKNWGKSWIVWPVASLLSAAVTNYMGVE